MDYKIFDGHNDVLFRLFLKNKPDSYLDFIDGDKEGHLDLPRMNQANFKGGLCAIY
ncbi:membrane dipeptidase, partial [bacterium]|nr:membrane dipeptidase [bacterium]